MYGSLVLYPKTSTTRGAFWPRVELNGKIIKGIFDYSNCSRAGHGLAIYYALPPGKYLIHEILSWHHRRDYIIEVNENGEIHETEEISRY